MKTLFGVLAVLLIVAGASYGGTIYEKKIYMDGESVSHDPNSYTSRLIEVPMGGEAGKILYISGFTSNDGAYSTSSLMVDRHSDDFTVYLYDQYEADWADSIKLNNNTTKLVYTKTASTSNFIENTNIYSFTCDDSNSTESLFIGVYNADDSYSSDFDFKLRYVLDKKNDQGSVTAEDQ